MPLSLSLSPRCVRRSAWGLAAALVAFATMPVQAQTPVRFTLDGRAEGTAAIFLMALEKGHFKAEGLDVVIDTGTGSREGIPKLAANAYDLGIADVNTLIRYRDENLASDMKAVLMLHDRPAFAIVGRKSRGVTEDPKSLEGKKIGAPAADVSYAAWPIFRRLVGIDDSKIRYETIGPPVREPMLASGEVDAVFGQASTTYVNLKARGVPSDDIVVTRMADHGLELYGSAVIASPKFVAEKPEAIRGFLRAAVKGLRDTLADRDLATQLVLRRNDVARAEVELERLTMVLDQNVLTPAVKERGFGDIDPARWSRALDQIAASASLRDKARAGNAFTDAFLPSLEDRKL